MVTHANFRNLKDWPVLSKKLIISLTTQKSWSELCHFKFIKHTWFDTNNEANQSESSHFLLLFIQFSEILLSTQVAFKYRKRKLLL